MLAQTSSVDLDGAETGAFFATAAFCFTTGGAAFFFVAAGAFFFTVGVATFFTTETFCFTAAFFATETFFITAGGVAFFFVEAGDLFSAEAFFAEAVLSCFATILAALSAAAIAAELLPARFNSFLAMCWTIVPSWRISSFTAGAEGAFAG